MMVRAQALVASKLESFKTFPPRQKPATFNLSAVLAKMTEGGLASH